MSNELTQVKITTPVKVGMLLLIGVCLVSSWFVVQWYFGNTIAQNLISDQTQLATAEMAVRMAPKDPLPHWRLANLIQTELHSDQISRVVAEYEQAVSLAPHDYRFWMALGSALEQAGDSDRAEKALRTAVSLAPSYAEPRWHLGNLLLRKGLYPEAFAELQRASNANDKLQPQLFNLAWQVNKADFESLRAAIGNSPSARAQFSHYLVVRGKVDEGLRLWNSLSDDERKLNRSAGEEITAGLITAKQFHRAIEVWKDIAPAATHRAQLGQFLDPGFEDNVINIPGAVFDWKVPSIPLVQITPDSSQGHSGSRSLKLVFQARNQLDAINVAQLVPVLPGTQYDLEFYFKTDKLLSTATPIVSVTDAGDDSSLANSIALPTGENDWQRASVTFKTGPKTEALKVSINRTRCEDESQVCPIYGTVWYDDFNLKARK